MLLLLLLVMMMVRWRRRRRRMVSYISLHDMVLRQRNNFSFIFISVGRLC
jgi:hypothetical protein